nr:DUF3987 domain-containing protein [Loktanella sp. SALINAS62]
MPPQDTEAAAGWPSVDLNLIGAMPEVKVPLDIFPDAIADFIRAVARTTGASEGYVVATLLAMTSAAIGNARIGRVGPEWTVPSILWFLLVGVPASGKSPAMGRTLKPYRGLEAEWRAAHAAVGQPGMDSVEAGWRQADAHERGQTVSAGIGPAPQFMCELMTFNGMIELMQKHPRGMLVTADEIAGLIKSMPANLRALFLKSFDGDDFRRNLKNESIDLPRVAMSMVGCMQPGILKTLLPNLALDGALARFFVVLGAPQSAGDLDAHINDGPVLEMLRGLRALQMDAGPSGPVPRDVPFTRDARDLIADRMAAARLAHETGMMEGIIAKSDGTVARLALVLALMRVVSGAPDTTETVAAEDVRNAGKLFDDYLLPMARSAFWLNGCTEIELAARAVIVKLQAERVASITVRELQRMAPSKFDKGDAFTDLMIWLERAHVLRLMPAAPSGPQGGAPSKRAMVNPQIWPPGEAPQPS